MSEGRYRHLTFEEREQIAVWRLEGVSQAAMARRLGRWSSTINRELARNRLPSGGYQPSFAEGSYLARRERAAVLERDERLERFVVDRLTEGWTPEQIAGRHGLLTMALAGLDRSPPAIDGSRPATSQGCAGWARRPSIASSIGPGRESRSSGNCCGAASSGAVGASAARRRARSLIGARSTIGPKLSRTARISAIGRPISCSAGARSRFRCCTSAPRG